MSLSPTTPVLDKVPAEMMEMIIKALPKKSISSFRLTCKRMAEIGAKYLVEEIHVTNLVKSFANLVKLSEHPQLKDHVKSIHYECTVLRDYVRSLHYRGASVERRKMGDFSYEHWKVWLKRPYGTYTPEELAQGYDAYLNLALETDAFERIGDSPVQDLLSFQNALPKFPKLKEIRVDSDGVSEALEEAFSSTLLDLGKLRQDEQNTCRTYYQEGMCGTREVGTILRIVVLGDIKIDTLRASTFHWNVFTHLADHQPLEYLPIFCNLKRLELKFIEEQGDRFKDDLKVLRETTLGRLLRHAEDLEVLSLEFSDVSGAYHDREQGFEPPRWSALALDMTWPKLKSLKLAVVDVEEEHITDFMKRHSSTLKVLHLAELLLEKGTWNGLSNWNSTLRSFKQDLNLSEVKFSGVFWLPGSPYEEMYQSYHPSFHLPMSSECKDSGIGLVLGGREWLGTQLERYFLEGGRDVEGGRDEDPLGEWGNGVLPEDVNLDDESGPINWTCPWNFEVGINGQAMSSG